jgi:membrane protein implicated in regulation of membrane protease activity
LPDQISSGMLYTVISDINQGIIDAMNETDTPIQPLAPPELPAGEAYISSETPEIESSQQQKRIIISVVAVVLVMLALFIGATYVLLMPGIDTARVRDLFIIYMGFQSLVIGLVLIILMIQLARLINLLQNEIKPILDSTNETVSNLRGTTAFLSDHLVGPVIKLNEYLAGLSEALGVFGLIRRKKK